MQGSPDMLAQLLGQLGLGAAHMNYTLPANAYYGGLQRQPYHADPRFMPQQEQQDPVQAMGMAPGAPMDPMAAMGGQQQVDPALLQMLGGVGLG